MRDTKTEVDDFSVLCKILHYELFHFSTNRIDTIGQHFNYLALYDCLEWLFSRHAERPRRLDCIIACRDAALDTDVNNEYI